jgi:hypothetical protein
VSYVYQLSRFLLVFFLSWIRFIRNTFVFYRGNKTWTHFFFNALDAFLNCAFWFMIFFFSMVNQPCPYATLPFIYYSIKYYLNNIKNNKSLVSTKEQRLSKIYGITFFLHVSPVYLTTILYNFKHYIYIANYKLLSFKTNVYLALFSKSKNRKYNMFNNYVKTKVLDLLDTRALLIKANWFPLSKRSPYYKMSKRF